MRRFLRLVPGEGGAIAADALAELAAIVAAHARVAREHGVVEVHVVGTAAVRAASNRDELCAAVQRACGIDVEILTGEQEAALAFTGALATLASPPAGTIGVIDVGGGSCELVTGTAAEGVTWWRSVADRLRDPGRPPPALRPAGARRARRRPGRDRRGARRRRPARDRPRPRRRRQRHDAGGGQRRRAGAGHHRPHPGRPARPSRRPRRRSGWACTSSACACCRRGCWRSRRPGRPSARRPCRSRAGACARASSCAHSAVVVEWLANGQSRVTSPACTPISATAKRPRGRSPSARRSSSSTPKASSTPPRSSASTTCASPAGGCARCSRSTSRASRARRCATSSTTSRPWPTRSASAAIPTCTWPSSRSSPPRSRRPTAPASRSSPSACAPSRTRATRRSPAPWPPSSRPTCAVASPR